MFKLESTIGNTPMIKINYEYEGKLNYIYAKLEYYNVSGSIKDRVAYYIIKKAKERGELEDGMPIIEATSGNTGIALASLGKKLNHDVYIFMPNWVSEERTKLLQSLGAKVILISKEEGGFVKCLEEAKKKSKEINGFWTNQFANEDNILAHYETTAEEFIRQTPERIYGFVSGVGTGGTLIGVGKRLKEIDNNIKIVAIEPDKMPMISKGEIISQHKIEGIGDDFIPDLFDRKYVDDVILINDEDAINMSRKLSANLGLGVGISSGANFLGSVLLSNNIDKPIITVFADDNKKYLSTELFDKISDNKEYISNKIKLIDYTIV